VTAILPPVSRFTPTGEGYAKQRRIVRDRLNRFFDR